REYRNTLYLFEQRPDENWEEAANFGNSRKIVGTEKVLEKILEDNDNLPDQLLFVRSRLFDMLIGDWGRHEDQWRWAEVEKDDRKIYEPVPRDRDQAYTKFDGTLLSVAIGAAGLSHLQSFNYKIKKVKIYNYPARNLDRKFASEPSLEDWVCIAKDLQSRITDSVIENAVRKLPPEVYPISGDEIIAKLKSRRNRLVNFATTYYEVLAKKVDVVGSDEEEYFDVKRLNDQETEVTVYKINKEGVVKPDPIYKRVFNRSETKEVRLYGLKGTDVFKLNGNVRKGIKVRVIGGPGLDSIIDRSFVKRGYQRVEVYDDALNIFKASPKTKVHIKNDSSIHTYHYDSYTPDKSGFRPSVFYSNEDRFYVSLGYVIRRNQWRKYPFAYEHGLHAHYSLTEKAFSLTYAGVYNQVVGKWNLSLNANWDQIRWTNFFGLGNETTVETTDRDFYRMRTRHYTAGLGLFRNLGKYQFFSLSGFYQNIKIIDDPERLIAKIYNPPQDLHDAKDFVGLQANYRYSMTGDQIVPSKGSDFTSSLAYVHNLCDPDSSFANLSASFNTYLPLSRQFILVIRGGAATIAGTPEFYQYNTIGGSQKLRGYRRDRFYGKTSVNNNNELQWISTIKSRIFNGKAGLIAFYDIGRVWMPGEVSSTWHSGYGAGVLLAPFNKVSLSVTYGISSEISLFHIRFNKVLL
ncbi:MAG TPA: BamA/TamA family outer membrane protein, partial [Chitinophagaceae bacterium]|nr:BamA/TamA family outer membrane protein [Chitinophagaceae bacterium]